MKKSFRLAIALVALFSFGIEGYAQTPSFSFKIVAINPVSANVDSLKVLGYDLDLILDSTKAIDTNTIRIWRTSINTDPSAKDFLRYGATLNKDSSISLGTVPLGVNQTVIDVDSLAVSTLYYLQPTGFGDSVGPISGNILTEKTLPVPAGEMTIFSLACQDDSVMYYKLTNNDAGAIVQAIIDTVPGLNSPGVQVSGATPAPVVNDAVLSISVKDLLATFPNATAVTFYGAVMLQLSDSNLSTIADTTLCTTVTDVKDREVITAKDITLYPNPVTESMNISIRGFRPGDSYTLRVCDLMGVEVIVEVLTKANTNIARRNISSGTYIYSVRTKDGEMVKGGTITVIE